MKQDSEMAEPEVQIERHQSEERRLLAQLEAELQEIRAMVEMALESIPSGETNREIPEG